MNNQINIQIASKAIKKIDKILKLIEEVQPSISKLEKLGFKITMDASNFNLTI